MERRVNRKKKIARWKGPGGKKYAKGSKSGRKGTYLLHPVNLDRGARLK